MVPYNSQHVPLSLNNILQCRFIMDSTFYLYESKYHITRYIQFMNRRKSFSYLNIRCFKYSNMKIGKCQNTNHHGA